MTPQEFQEIVTTIHDRHIGDQLPQLHDLEWSALALCGEAGELANKVKKIRRDLPDSYGPGYGPDDYLAREAGCVAELADVLTYAAVVAACLGRTFQSVMEQAAEQSIEWDRGRT